MSPEALELAKRLGAHPRWEWHDDMIAAVLSRSGEHYMSDPWPACSASLATLNGCTHLPDLDSTATVGTLEGLLVEAVRWINVCNIPHSMGDLDGGMYWEVTLPGDLFPPGEDEIEGATRGEAVAKALLAAWSVPDG